MSVSHGVVTPRRKPKRRRLVLPTLYKWMSPRHTVNATDQLALWIMGVWDAESPAGKRRRHDLQILWNTTSQRFAFHAQWIPNLMHVMEKFRHHDKTYRMNVPWLSSGHPWSLPAVCWAVHPTHCSTRVLSVYEHNRSQPMLTRDSMTRVHQTITVWNHRMDEWSAKQLTNDHFYLQQIHQQLTHGSTKAPRQQWITCDSSRWLVSTAVSANVYEAQLCSNQLIVVQNPRNSNKQKGFRVIPSMLGDLGLVYDCLSIECLVSDPNLELLAAVADSFQHAYAVYRLWIRASREPNLPLTCIASECKHYLFLQSPSGDGLEWTAYNQYQFLWWWRWLDPYIDIVLTRLQTRFRLAPATLLPTGSNGPCPYCFQYCSLSPKQCGMVLTMPSTSSVLSTQTQPLVPYMPRPLLHGLVAWTWNQSLLASTSAAINSQVPRTIDSMLTTQPPFRANKRRWLQKTMVTTRVTDVQPTVDMAVEYPTSSTTLPWAGWMRHWSSLLGTIDTHQICCTQQESRTVTVPVHTLSLVKSTPAWCCVGYTWIPTLNIVPGLTKPIQRHLLVRMHCTDHGATVIVHVDRIDGRLMLYRQGDLPNKNVPARIEWIVSPSVLEQLLSE